MATDPVAIEKTVQALHPALISGRGVVFSCQESGKESWVLLQELERRHHPTGDGAGAVLMPMIDRRKSHAAPLSQWSPDERLSLESLAMGIAGEVEKAHQILLSRVCFLHPDTLPKEAGGELHRVQSRDMFLAGKLEIVGEWKRG